MRFINIRKFDGGLLNINAIDVGQEGLNNIRAGQNIRTRSGAVRVRDGITDYCDFSGTAFAGHDLRTLYTYIREYVSGSTIEYWKALVFTVGNDIYYCQPEVSTTVAYKINSTALSSGDVYCINVFDHLFVANGIDEVMTWDGNNWYQAGISAPSSPPSCTAVGGGSLSGYRKYKYTYYRDHSSSPYLKESEASNEVEVDLTAGSQQVNITLTASSDSQVTHNKVYATPTYTDPANPATDFYLLATQDAGVLTLTDNTSDATLTAQSTYDTTTRNIPPRIKYMLWHDNRIFGAGDQSNPSILYYSQIGKPFYWNTAEFWDEISRDDGEVITALGAIGSTRFIFKESSIWEWTGDPESVTPIRPVERPDATQNDTRVGVGCNDPRSLAAWGNSLIFRAGDGHVYLLTMDSLVQLSKFIKDDIVSMGTTCAAVYDDYYIITDGVTTLVCDLRRGELGWEGRDTNVLANCFCIDYNNYLLGAETAKIVRYYTGTDDNGADIPWYVQTAYVDVGGSDREAIPRRVAAKCRSRLADFTITVYNEVKAINTGTYATTDRFYSIARGDRADYISVRLACDGSGTNIINGISIGYILSARHDVRGV